VLNFEAWGFIRGLCHVLASFAFPLNRIVGVHYGFREFLHRNQIDSRTSLVVTIAFA